MTRFYRGTPPPTGLQAYSLAIFVSSIMSLSHVGGLQPNCSLHLFQDALIAQNLYTPDSKRSTYRNAESHQTVSRTLNLRRIGRHR